MMLGIGLAASAVACASAPLEGNPTGDASADASADAADAGVAEPYDGGTVVAVYGAPACDVGALTPTGTTESLAGGAVFGVALLVTARRRRPRE
jgi:hypothetical protein